MSQFGSGLRSHHHPQGRACRGTAVQHSNGRPPIPIRARTFDPFDATAPTSHEPIPPSSWHSSRRFVTDPPAETRYQEVGDSWSIPQRFPYTGTHRHSDLPSRIIQASPAAAQTGISQAIPPHSSHPQMQSPTRSSHGATRGVEGHNAWRRGCQPRHSGPGYRAHFTSHGRPVGHPLRPGMPMPQALDFNGSQHLGNGGLHPQSSQHKPEPYHHSGQTQSTGSQQRPIPRTTTLAELKGAALWDLESQPSRPSPWDDCSPAPDDGSEFGYRYMDPTWHQRVLTWLHGVSEGIRLENGVGPVNVLGDPPDDVWSMDGSEDFFWEFKSSRRGSSVEGEDQPGDQVGSLRDAQAQGHRANGQHKHGFTRPQGRGKHHDDAPPTTVPGAPAAAEKKKRRRGRPRGAPPKPEPRTVLRDGELVLLEDAEADGRSN